MKKPPEGGLQWGDDAQAVGLFTTDVAFTPQSD
jgi:hypothetical protein